MKVLVFLLFVAVASANNSTDSPIDLDEIPDSIITNGFNATEGRAPYIVYLLFQNAVCGGSIIGHNWVITASHCTKPYNSVTIYYGSLQRSQGHQVVHTVGRENFINHPNDDIALIHTPHVDFSNKVNRVLLPRMSDSNNQYVNQYGLACGWGKTTTTNHPENLQCVGLRVISVPECQRTYSARYAKPQILCVATPAGRSICYGDSGGPLVRNNRLIGVSNFVSARGCTSGEPAGFARVTSHLNWIHQYTGISY